MPDTDPNGDTAVDDVAHLARVAEQATRGHNLALRTSGKWAAWARHIDGLLRTVPPFTHPYYLDECGESVSPELQLPVGMTRGTIADHLRRARADADAMAAAYEHLAEEISRRTEAILNPPSEHEHRFPWPLGPNAIPWPCECGEPAPLAAGRPGGAR